MLSLGSNKPGKQSVHRLKCHLEKCHRYLDTVHEESGIPSTGTTCKKGETGQGIYGVRNDLVTECMYEKEKEILILSGDFSFRFSAENESPF